MRTLLLAVTAVALYLGSYHRIVAPEKRTQKVGLRVVTYTQPTYGFGDLESSGYRFTKLLFWPVHYLDRTVRRDFWAANNTPYRLAPPSLFPVFECKYLGRGTLRTRAGRLDEGWTIHETITWRIRKGVAR